jgi:hypothetical protein
MTNLLVTPKTTKLFHTISQTLFVSEQKANNKNQGIREFKKGDCESFIEE